MQTFTTLELKTGITKRGLLMASASTAALVGVIGATTALATDYGPGALPAGPIVTSDTAVGVDDNIIGAALGDGSQDWTVQNAAELSAVGASLLNINTMTNNAGGTITLNGGLIQAVDTVTNNGAIAMSGASSIFGNNGITNGDGGSIDVAAGSASGLTVGVGQTVTNTSTGANSATITTNGALTVTGNLLNTNAAPGGNSTITVNGPGSLVVSDTFTNQATVQVTGSGQVAAQTIVNDGGQISSDGSNSVMAATNPVGANTDGLVTTEGLVTNSNGGSISFMGQIDANVVNTGVGTSFGTPGGATPGQTLNIDGNINNQTGANVTVNNNDVMNVNGGTVTNTGTVTVSPVGTLGVATFENESGGTLDINAGYLMGPGDTPVALNNDGLVTASGWINGAVLNAGGATFRTDGGNLAMTTNNGATGNFTNATNGTLEVTGGNFTDIQTLQTDGQTTIGTGFTLSAVTINNTANGTVDNAGTVTGTTLTNTGTYNQVDPTGTASSTFTGNSTSSNLLNIADGSFTMQGGATLDLSGTTLVGNNDAVAASLNMGTGLLQIVGAADTLTVGTDGTVNAGGGLTNGGSFTNNGTVNVTDNFITTATGVSTIGTGATLAVTGAGNVSNGGQLTVGGTLTGVTFNNSGAFVQNGGTSTFTGNGTNGNRVDIQDGTVTFGGTYTTTDTTLVGDAVGAAGSAVLNVGGLTTISVGPGLQVESDGLLVTNGIDNDGATGLRNLGGTITNTGDIDTATEFTNTGTTTTDTMTVSGGSMTNSGTFTASGAVTNAANLTNSGTFTSASLSNAGTATNSGTMNTGDLSNTGTFTNSGTVTASGAATNTASLTNSGTFTSASLSNGGLGTNSGTMNIGDFSNTGTFTNSGAMTGTGYTNSGLFNADSGSTAAFSGAGTDTGTLNIDNNASMTFGGGLTSSGVINLDGTLGGNVTSTGVFAIDRVGTATATTAVVDGNLSATGSGVLLSLEGDGADAANGNGADDRLTVNGTLTTNRIAADLSVTGGAGVSDTVQVAGFVPSGGSTQLSFEVVPGSDTNVSGLEILVVDSTGGALNPADFTLAAQNTTRFDEDELGSAIIVYSLDNGTGATPGIGAEDIVLRSQLNPGVAAVAGQIESVQALLNGVINRPTSPLIAGLVFDADKNRSEGLWFRGMGGTAEITSNTFNGVSTLPTTVDADYAGFQIGYDSGTFTAFDGGEDVIIGGMAGFLSGSTKANNFAIDPNDPTKLLTSAGVSSVTESDFDQRYVGGYVAYASGLFSGDVQLRFQQTDFTFNNPTLDLNNAETESTSVTLSTSANYVYQVNDNVFIVPTGGFAITNTSTDAVTFTNAATGGATGRLRMPDHTTIMGFLGATAGYQTISAAGDSALTRFVTATLYDDMSGDRRTIFDIIDGTGAVTSSVPLSTEDLGTFGELSVGFNYVQILNDGQIGAARQINTGVRLDTRFSDRIEAYNLTAQARLQF